MRVRLLTVIPSIVDSTSFYRGQGPISHLLRSFPGDLSQLMVQQYSWATISPADIVFLQRPYADEHLQIVEMAKDIGKPVWLDYDDDLFSVPEDNPSFRVYGKENIRKNIAKMCAMADHITVSTGALGHRLSKLNKNISVIPNALNEEMFKYRNSDNIMRNKLALWRGSDTHQRDLAEFSPEIVGLIREHKDWTWTFLGYNPWFITSAVPKERALIMEAIDVIQYHKAIHKMRPAFIHVPLHNGGFNQSKSNIAWLEAVFAGGVAVVPDWDEWQTPGALLYKDQAEYTQIVSDLMGRFGEYSWRQNLAQQNGDAWKYVQERLTLKVTNQLRTQVIERLMGEAQ